MPSMQQKTLPNDVAAFINMIKNGNFGDSKIAELASTGLQNATDYIENYQKVTAGAAADCSSASK